MTRDETIRWSTKAGDYVLWLKWPFLADEPSLVDFFYFREGEYFLITDRDVDLPAGFELHPTEVANRYVPPMMAKIDAGWQPTDPVEATFIWRASAGDRLVWLRPSDASKPILEVIDLPVCVVACVAFSGTASLEQIMNLGSAPDDYDRATVGAAFQAAKAHMIAMGPARTSVDEWSFGS